MPTEEDWAKDFEPGCRNYDIGLQPLVSIAISLKRIADTMDGTAAGVCVTETIFSKPR